tara:strand:- start:506 stop:2101 length:1596 start_codon:yes stop_codon:yes gene_type:complete
MPTSLGNSESIYDDVAAPTHTKYVSKTGHDTDNDGNSASAPYLTIAKAIDALDTIDDTKGETIGSGTRVLILVESGSYEELITCDSVRNLTVRGCGPGFADPSILRPSIVGDGSSNLQNSSHNADGSAAVNTNNLNNPSPGDGGGLIIENLHFSNWIRTGGHCYKSNIGASARFLNCEFSQSHGGLSHVIRNLTPGESADWPSRVDSCTFRGGSPLDRGLGMDLSLGGTAIQVGTVGTADTLYITNNVIYGHATGIDGGSGRANIYNNTVVSCSYGGIYAVGPAKIVNNIVARCGGHSTNGWGLQVAASEGWSVRLNNILTGNMRHEDGNGEVFDADKAYDVLEYGGSSPAALVATELRVNPGLRQTGTVGTNTEFNPAVFPNGGGPFMHETPDFRIAAVGSAAVSNGSDTVRAGILNSGNRGYKRSSARVEVGAHAFLQWREPVETTTPDISSDFTINRTFKNPPDDHTLLDIDGAPIGSAVAAGADPTPPPFSRGIKGVANLHGTGGSYKLTPAAAGRKSPDKITKNDS